MVRSIKSKNHLITKKLISNNTKTMKKLSILLILALFAGIQANAADKDFKPNGKVNVKIFSNFHSSFSDGENANAFEIKRAYFGYGYNFSKHFSGKITLDVANPKVGGLEMTALLKHAFLTYKQNGFKVDFGLIGTTQFELQRKAWGYRYIYKTFQNQHKFNSSADLGVRVAYKFSKAFSADFILSNGEGYKKLAADSSLRVGLGVTVNPVKALTLRAYYDFIEKHNVNQQSLALFAGYKTGDISFGLEYNKQLNTTNAADKDLDGFSFHTTYKASKKVKIFGRYDKLSSSDAMDMEWNLAKDGSILIIGLEYAPVKGVKIAPNYQGWNPKDAAQKYMTGIFMNLEIKI